MKIRISDLNGVVATKFDTTAFKSSFNKFIYAISDIKDIVVRVRSDGIFHLAKIAEIHNSGLKPVALRFELLHKKTNHIIELMVELEEIEEVKGIEEAKNVIVERLSKVKKSLTREISNLQRAYNDSIVFNPFKHLRRGA